MLGNVAEKRIGFFILENVAEYEYEDNLLQG